MRAIDLENTLYLTALLRDVGWIDAERFGPQAHGAAFLIVQHSPHLRLMRTVLPVLEGEARANRSQGQRFALLHDRLSLSLCGSQRYGTQLVTGRDDAYYVTRLEAPEGVDARRAELGMGTLEEYLALYRGQGIRVVIGDP